MAAPQLSSRIPAINATNIYLNQLIYLVFDQNVDSSTLTDNTILVYRSSDYELIDKTIGYSSSTYTATITPDSIFDENTTYNVVVVGADQSSTCVKNASSESLVTTATWYFTTGTELYEAPEDTIPETQPDTPVASSPVAKVLEPRSQTSFAITKTTPGNYGTNLGTESSDHTTVTWGDSVSVKFNRLLASGTAVEQDWIALSVEAVDGDPSTTTATPSGTVANVTGDTITWTPSTYQDNHTTWRVNNEVTVTVSEDVKDYQGNLLSDDYEFMFTTCYYPLYSTVKKIRTAIGPFIRDVNDDVINRTIYLNSLEAYNIANVMYDQSQWALSSPTFAAKMWVFCKTQYDLLHARLLDMASSGAGEMKRLGDFSIQEGTEVQDGVKSSIAKALECSNAWLKQLLGKYRRARAKMVIKGVANPATPPMRGVRTWSVPEDGRLGANKRTERILKSPGVYSDWS